MLQKERQSFGATERDTEMVKESKNEDWKCKHQGMLKKERQRDFQKDRQRKPKRNRVREREREKVQY